MNDIMIRKKEEMELQHVIDTGNIKGEITKRHFLYPDETYGKTAMCATIELPHGSMIAEHDHTDDAELYYLLDGEALVTDNDTYSTPETWCSPAAATVTASATKAAPRFIL